ncbi:MAG: pentapeptide repeat-containing protein [Symploca sp. SIO1C4]|uniref:Pentapeptide repeat-containing protein n=1 Tax=Symploca sp. SIO1C4 TaxID=2607765 RepID=A0A6B3NDI1_9CYAN|nr:pentapeptide repeat-containing protein [Symploca sp. SIO1C4]
MKPLTKSQFESIGKNLTFKGEHLALFKQGVDTWNAWRQENPEIIPLLSRVDLRDANLSAANLMRTYLSGANLSENNLSGNNLSEANLSEANLSRIQALGTNFYGAILTGACIQDWNINSQTNLDNVICEYVYLRGNQQERRPSSGNFAPGEFTKLFQESLETVDLIFREGVDWKAFAYSLTNTQIENEGTPLAIQSIENKGDGVVLIRVSVPADADKVKIHEYFMKGYEFAKKELEPIYQARLEDKDKEINRLFYAYNQAQEKLGEVPKLMAEKSTYDLRGAKFGGGFGGEKQEGGTFYDYSSSSNTSLTEATAEIQQLLEQLSKTNPTATTAEKMAVVTQVTEQIESNPTLKARVINALKSGGIEAFKEAIDHPLVNIFVATIEGWKDAE